MLGQDKGKEWQTKRYFVTHSVHVNSHSCGQARLVVSKFSRQLLLNEKMSATKEVLTKRKLCFIITVIQVNVEVDVFGCFVKSSADAYRLKSLVMATRGQTLSQPKSLVMGQPSIESRRTECLGSPTGTAIAGL